MTFYSDNSAQQKKICETTKQSSKFFVQNGSSAQIADDIDDYVKENESLFCTYDYLSVFCGTYNVNGQSSSIADLSKWLRPKKTKEPPDIYAVGFQELDRSQQAYILSTSGREDEWAPTVHKHLPRKGEYVELKRVRLVGIFLIVYIKKALRQYVDTKSIDSVYIATGLLNMLGNKGGVAVSFLMYDTRICFVVSHLAAGSEELLRRNQDFREICKLKFLQNSLDPKKHLDLFGKHDLIFWLGDLNYRLQDRQTGFSLDVKLVKEKCALKLYNELLECDQLLDVRDKKLAFHEFQEGPVTFAPTYKYDTGTSVWDSSEKCRAPAWTDRILWYGRHVDQIVYDSVPELLISDHKPVFSLFKIRVKKIDAEKEKKIYEGALKFADRLANERLPQAEIDQLFFTFDNVTFRDMQSQIFNIRNVGKDPFQYVFKEKDEKNKQVCEPWLTITPPTFRVMPDEQAAVTLTVFVDKFSLRKFNTTNNFMLDDILVLHLNHGKDFFLSVSATFKPTCFGRPLSTISTTIAPPSDLLIDLTPEDQSRPQSTSLSLPQMLGVPTELYRLVDHILKFGLETPRLLEEPPSQDDFIRIRDSLEAGGSEVFQASVFSVIETLVLFLDTLPEPVVPRTLTEACLKNYEDWLACKKIVAEIPECHKAVFMFMIDFLKELKNKGHKNGCSTSTLASIFAPFLLKPNGDETASSKAQETLYEYRLKCATQFLKNWILH